MTCFGKFMLMNGGNALPCMSNPAYAVRAAAQAGQLCHNHGAFSSAWYVCIDIGLHVALSLIYLLAQAWIDITSRIEKAMRQLESDSPPNRSQLPKVAVNGESLKEVAPKLPGKTE